MIFVLVVEAIIKSQVALQSPTPQIFIYNPTFSAHYWCCWITKHTSRLFLKEDYCPLVSYKWQEAECAQYPINYNSDEILCKFRMSWNMPTHVLIVSDAVPGKFVWTCKLFMMAVSSVSFLSVLTQLLLNLNELMSLTVRTQCWFYCNVLIVLGIVPSGFRHFFLLLVIE